MTHEGSPCFDGSPPAPPRVGWRFGAACVASSCLGLLPGGAPSAEPPALVVDADARHEMLARRALFQDRLLAPLNLGVRVHNHVAVLWGPVPSADLARRAVEVLQRMPELVEVRTELHVQPPEDPQPALPDLPSPRPSPMGPTLPPTVSQWLPPSSGMLTKHSALSPPGSPAGNPQWMPGEGSGSSKVSRDEGQGEPVLPAIAIPRPAGAPAGTAAGEWLIESVTRLQRSDPRFYQLRPEVRGKMVQLHGEVRQWADVYDLARRLARLPGVERVVLGDIRTRDAGR